MPQEPIWDMDEETGLPITGWERCRQSIIIILTTRLNMRLMRLWFGSELLDMMDRPLNESTIMDAIHAGADPVNEFEPEFIVTRVLLHRAGSDGIADITVEGFYLPDEELKEVRVPLRRL